MASDSEKYRTALRKWENLHAEQHFSLPVESGRMAIFVTNEGYGETPKERAYTRDYMQVEAERYVLSFKDYYKSVELHRSITSDGLKAAVQDQTTSGIVIIGEGNFSSVYTNDESSQIWWPTISKWSTHLKQGVFFQRFCGTLPKESVPVPFGTFAMTSLSSVWAVPSKPFCPEYDKRIEEEFRPVSLYDSLPYEQIALTFTIPDRSKPSTLGMLLPAIQLVSRFTLPQ